MLAFLNGLILSKPPLDANVLPPTNTFTLVLAGYSYGSLIAKNLPPLQIVKEIFASPAAGSAQAEIILRAQDLSKDHMDKQQLVEVSIRGRNSLRASSGLVVGGNESGATSSRASRESSRRSLDLEGMRKSVDRIRKRSSRRISGRYDSSDSTQQGTHKTIAITPRICFLLVSPLLAPVTSFLSMSTKLKLPAGLIKGTAEVSSADQLMLHPCCCIFGHQDVFTSYKRLQKWAAKHEKDSEARFSTYSIEQAGHFWQEEGAQLRLRDAIEQWLREM
jgi:alpha/beta superfamily hydrolase